MFHCINPTCRALLSGDARWCPECGASVAVRPGAQLGDYLVEAHMEDGAVGSIWRARHLETQTTVAIKVLPYDRFPDPKQKEEAISRFAVEAEAVNQIQEHRQHFVPVYEISVASDGSPYFVMEYLHGQPLSRYLASKKILCGQEIFDLMGQLCRALSAVHHHQPKPIIHRDIKPENIFLVGNKEPSTSEAIPLVKILDFGLAKLDRKLGITQTNHALGTPHYMAPEQWQNAKYVDQRADIYALGLVLFEMLAGRRPFAEAGEALLEIMRSHVLYPPPVPSRFVPWRRLSPQLDLLLQKVLAKRPDARPSTCESFYTSLEQAMGSLIHETEEELTQKLPQN